MPEKLLHPDRAAHEEKPSASGAWADIPAGFEVLEYPARGQPRSGLGKLLRLRERILILKASLRDLLLEAGVQDPERLRTGPLVAAWIAGGRTKHALIRTKGEAWVLKAYRRGGVLGRWNSERYWGCSRFLDELRVAVLAERSGVATAEVLALILEGAGLGSVRAWLVTRYLPDVRPLTEYFGDPFEGPVFHAAGQVVRRMHVAGIDHHDLHLGNIVGAHDGTAPHAHIVDWDRARSRAPGAWSPHGNLARLWRSVEKGRQSGGFRVLRRPVRAFIRGYFEGQPGALREVRRYFRRRALFLGVRMWFWRAWR